MVRRITREELKRKMNREDDLVLIEVLSPDEYEQEHIKGAINIPLERVASEVKERFNPEREIVVYCANSACQASPTAAEKLDEIGFEKVYDYAEGKKDWKEAGYPME